MLVWTLLQRRRVRNALRNSSVCTHKVCSARGHCVLQASSPSSTEGPQVSTEDKEAFTKSMPTYRN